MKYRICENKYGFYKIQLLKEYNFLFIKRKRWVDGSFLGGKLHIYSNIETAKNDIDRFCHKDRINNKEWKVV